MKGTVTRAISYEQVELDLTAVKVKAVLVVILAASVEQLTRTGGGFSLEQVVQSSETKLGKNNKRYTQTRGF